MKFWSKKGLHESNKDVLFTIIMLLVYIIFTKRDCMISIKNTIYLKTQYRISWKPWSICLNILFTNLEMYYVAYIRIWTNNQMMGSNNTYRHNHSYHMVKPYYIAYYYSHEIHWTISNYIDKTIANLCIQSYNHLLLYNILLFRSSLVRSIFELLSLLSYLVLESNEVEERRDFNQIKVQSSKFYKYKIDSYFLLKMEEIVKWPLPYNKGII